MREWEVAFFVFFLSLAVEPRSNSLRNPILLLCNKEIKTYFPSRAFSVIVLLLNK